MTLSCRIHSFHPENLIVSWYKEDELLPSNHGLILTDPNELFYLTSHVTYNPHEEDRGKIFRCEVSHQSFEHPKSVSWELQKQNFVVVKEIVCKPDPMEYGEPLTLSCEVIGCEDDDITAKWWENDKPIKRQMKAETLTNTEAVFFLLTLTPTAEHCGKLFTCLVFHRKKRREIKRNISLKLPDKLPVLSEITAWPTFFEIKKEATFKITISGFSSKVLQVRWLKSFTALTENIVTTEPQIGKDGLYCCTSKIKYTPTDADLNMSIRCEVTASGETKRKEYLFTLKGSVHVKDIECSTHSPTYGEPLTLSCEVIGSNAQDITEEWQMDNNPIKEEMRAETQTNEDLVTYLLSLTPTAEHCGKLFTCLINAKDLAQPIKKSIWLKLPDKLPDLSEVEIYPRRLTIHKESSFQITISGFSQKNLKVNWFISSTPLTANIETTEPQIGEDMLYCCTSTLRHTPTAMDLNTSIRCKVTANGETREKNIRLNAEGIEILRLRISKSKDLTQILRSYDRRIIPSIER
ncbi:hypothetical protein XELAEV_18021681mg [Xenopus laevis]|uniref:Ig-like domain-containing protein n=1 Tax=Xenopus laevis TaxID=8355 RepID=A0A974HMI3_XENLA|nr:hypothetical protein XELAEV_18021681mg [Xenopus laevis]